MTNFREELTKLLNKMSEENTSNTPDYILAEFMLSCLTAFNNGVVIRDRWHGINVNSQRLIK